jgi:hypothetical protein
MNISRDFYKWKELRFASCTVYTFIRSRCSIQAEPRVHLSQRTTPETLLLFSWSTKISEDLDRDLFGRATPPLIPLVRSMTGWDNRYAVSPFIPCTKLSKDHNAPCGLTRGTVFPKEEKQIVGVCQRVLRFPRWKQVFWHNNENK